MNDQFTRQAQDMLAAAKEARIPENVQAFAEESVAKTRDAYTKINAATQDSVKAVEEIVLAAQAGAKTFSEKFLHAATVNAEAAFDAAEAMARAKTVPRGRSPAGRLLQAAARHRQLADEGVLRAVEQDQPADAREHEFGRQQDLRAVQEGRLVLAPS